VRTYKLHTFGIDGPFLDGIAAVYAQVLHLNWETEYPGFQHYARTFPDFCGFMALVTGEVVGVGWGTHTQPGEWLYDRVAAQIGGEHSALQDAWLLNILAVLESYRGQGIGSGLHDALLEAQLCSRALVCTHVENATARRFYEHKGWQYFQPGCIIQAGERQMVVLHKDCR
jgi:GNAT superfamily N-acetyltransferase